MLAFSPVVGGASTADRMAISHANESTVVDYSVLIVFLSGLLTATVTALAAPSWPTGLAITDFYIIHLDSGQVGTCGPIFSHKVLRTTVF